MSTRWTFSQLLWRVVMVLVLAAVAGAAALVLSHRQAKEYQATSLLAYGVALRPELQVLGAGANDGVSDATRINTAVAGLNSRDLAVRTQRANPDLRLSAKDIDTKVTATAQRDTQVAALSAIDSSAERVVRLVRAYAREAVAFQRQRERARAAAVARSLRAELRELPSSARRGERGAVLRQQLGALAVLERSGSGVPQVIQQAYRPDVAAAPQTGRNVLFGVIFGVALGIGLVALRPGQRLPERDDDRPGAEREAERVAVER
jgi:capsular polysaccharide biosynthesis protein